ncbi:MAG: hypothetical protein KatS3mg107_1106 [Gemmataceae bacterium]|nr:MAG: hypothetical protein KatS3mg107_1106 [Gemmataceae bacterium]
MEFDGRLREWRSLKTGEGSVVSAWPHAALLLVSALDKVSALPGYGSGEGTVDCAGEEGKLVDQPGAPSEGTTVKLLRHRGQVALAPTADSGARTPPSRQYGQMAIIVGIAHPAEVRRESLSPFSTFYATTDPRAALVTFGSLN